MIRCRSLAEIPVRRVEISKIARNHILSGLWVFSSSVPDVRLVWCPQSAHSNVVPSRIVHTCVELQRAHDGSPPQRAAIQARQSSVAATASFAAPSDDRLTTEWEFCTPTFPPKGTRDG